MARPEQISLKKKEQTLILKEWKKRQNARVIANTHQLPRYQVMAFLENQGLVSFSEGSYR